MSKVKSEPPKYLYHGTRAGALSTILAGGLVPRRDRGVEGNWRHSIESNSRAVYLTDAYPLHFAGSAARVGEPLLIFEVVVQKLHPFSLAPDEDFLEQATRGNDNFAAAGDDMKTRTRWFRHCALTEFASHWQDSLRGLGTCTYFGIIPPAAISRWAVVPASCPLVRMSDPTITLMNYQILGGYYRQLVRRIFGDPVDFGNAGSMRDLLERAASLGRDGIEVSSM